MNIEQRKRFLELLDAAENGNPDPEQQQELVGLGREAAKALDHLPLFCTFCGGLPGAGRVLRPHMHCNFCDPIVGYRCGDPCCDCAK